MKRKSEEKHTNQELWQKGQRYWEELERQEKNGQAESVENPGRWQKEQHQARMAN